MAKRSWFRSGPAWLRGHRRQKRTPWGPSTRRPLGFERLESRQLLSVSAQPADLSSFVAALLDTMRPQAPSEHVAADAAGSQEIVKLSVFTPCGLVTPTNQNAQKFYDGALAIENEITGNPDERPQVWGQLTVPDGAEYRLNLDPNGMPVGGWTIDWGDGTTPDNILDQPSIIHQYRQAGLHTINVTACSVDGSFSFASTGSDGSSGSQGLGVTVQDVPPVLRAAGDQAATVIDPTGGSDTQTLLVTVNDGGPAPGSDPAPETPAQGDVVSDPVLPPIAPDPGSVPIDQGSISTEPICFPTGPVGISTDLISSPADLGSVVVDAGSDPAQETSAQADVTTDLGGTQIYDGTLQLGGSNYLSTSGSILLSGGTVGFDTGAWGTTPIIFSGGLVQNATLNNTSWANPFLTQSGTVSATLSGTTGLTKTGPGVMYLNANNNYVTTISSGTLDLNVGQSGTTWTNGGNLVLSSPTLTKGRYAPLRFGTGTLPASLWIYGGQSTTAVASAVPTDIVQTTIADTGLASDVDASQAVLNAADQPAAVDPAPVDPAPVDPAPVDPAPIDPAPVDAMPVDSLAADPAPVDPGQTAAPDAGTTSSVAADRAAANFNMSSFIASLLDTMRPQPPSEHVAADAVGPQAAVKLSAFTPCGLVTPRNQYAQQLYDGASTIFNEIAGNPDERPQVWGQLTVPDGTEYRLNFDANGMPVGGWTIDWGDGTSPQNIPAWPSVVHQYSQAGLYTINVTACSVDGSFSFGPDSSFTVAIENVSPATGDSAGNDGAAGSQGLGVMVQDVPAALRGAGDLPPEVPVEIALALPPAIPAQGGAILAAVSYRALSAAEGVVTFDALAGTNAGIIIHADAVSMPAVTTALGVVAQAPSANTAVASPAASWYSLPLGVYRYVFSTSQLQSYQQTAEGSLAALQSRGGNQGDMASLLAQPAENSLMAATVCYVTVESGAGAQSADDAVGWKNVSETYNLPDFATLILCAGNQQIVELTAPEIWLVSSAFASLNDRGPETASPLLPSSSLD